VASVDPRKSGEGEHYRTRMPENAARMAVIKHPMSGVLVESKNRAADGAAALDAVF
jgi:hypothetical protein